MARGLKGFCFLVLRRISDGKLMAIKRLRRHVSEIQRNAVEAIYRKTPEHAETVSPKQKSLAKKRGDSTACFKYTSDRNEHTTSLLIVNRKVNST